MSDCGVLDVLVVVVVGKLSFRGFWELVSQSLRSLGVRVWFECFCLLQTSRPPLEFLCAFFGLCVRACVRACVCVRLCGRVRHMCARECVMFFFLLVLAIMRGKTKPTERRENGTPVA